jgi:metal-responsive CopG/Arc/MetJ family transcriptional regulator
MSQQKKKLVALTFKIHPDLLEEIDNFIDNIGYRSRGHVINRIAIRRKGAVARHIV